MDILTSSSPFIILLLPLICLVTAEVFTRLILAWVGTPEFGTRRIKVDVFGTFENGNLCRFKLLWKKSTFYHLQNSKILIPRKFSAFNKRLPLCSAICLSLNNIGAVDRWRTEMFCLEEPWMMQTIHQIVRNKLMRSTLVQRLRASQHICLTSWRAERSAEKE